MNIFFKKTIKSFTIIELSVILTIIGILLSMSISGSHYVLEKYKIKKNNQKILLIQNALQNYFNTYERLPRPAKYDIKRNNENFGKESTSKIVNNWSARTNYYSSSFIFDKTNNKNKEEIHKIDINTRIFYGIVPFKELKLTENDVIDIYGNYIEYYVPEIITVKKNDSIDEMHNPLIGKITKAGYFEKTPKSGTYDKYLCPFIYAQNNAICEKTDDIVYGVSFRQREIPENYTQLTYIESTGKQFINTNINPSFGKIEMIFNIMPTKFLNLNKKDCFFSTKKDWFSFEYSSLNDSLFAYFNAGESKFLAKHKSLTINKNNEYDILYDNNILTINGTFNNKIEYNGNLPDDKIYFFSNNENSCNSNIKLFSLKIYQNDSLVRDYIPCLRKNDNGIGLYDKVNNMFYSNHGAGDFVKGEEKQNDYIEYIISPYGLKIKNIETDLSIDNNFAYILLSHGKNGKKTCAISKPSSTSLEPTLISLLNASNANITTKYEAQNCMHIDSNSSLDIIGRNDFLSSNNKEITFYRGTENSDFDDICEYKTLTELVNNFKSKI